jgi:hypothetical protein
MAIILRRFLLIVVPTSPHLITRFFASGFFMNQFPPSPRVSVLGPFHIFSKTCGDSRKARCTTGINHIGGKFATGIDDSGGKFCHQFR